MTTCQCNCKNNVPMKTESNIPAGYEKVERGATLEQVGIAIGIIMFVVNILMMVFLRTTMNSRGYYYRRWY